MGKTARASVGALGVVPGLWELSLNSFIVKYFHSIINVLPLYHFLCVFTVEFQS